MLAVHPTIEVKQLLVLADTREGHLAINTIMGESGPVIEVPDDTEVFGATTGLSAINPDVLTNAGMVYDEDELVWSPANGVKDYTFYSLVSGEINYDPEKRFKELINRFSKDGSDPLSDSLTAVLRNIRRQWRNGNYSANAGSTERAVLTLNVLSREVLTGHVKLWDVDFTRAEARVALDKIMTVSHFLANLPVQDY